MKISVRHRGHIKWALVFVLVTLGVAWGTEPVRSSDPVETVVKVGNQNRKLQTEKEPRRDVTGGPSPLAIPRRELALKGEQKDPSRSHLYAYHDQAACFGGRCWSEPQNCV